MALRNGIAALSFAVFIFWLALIKFSLQVSDKEKCTPIPVTTTFNKESLNFSITVEHKHFFSFILNDEAFSDNKKMQVYYNVTDPVSFDAKNEINQRA
jgi:hypothetical protein